MSTKTNKELRTALLHVFDDLKSGVINQSEAKETINAAGKIMNTVKLELEYAMLRKVEPKIPFLD